MQLPQKRAKWLIIPTSIFVLRLNMPLIAVGRCEKAGRGDIPGGDCIVCSEIAMGVQEPFIRHRAAQKTIPKISVGLSTDAHTKFRPGLEKVNCDERI